mmetsp:Transcript_22375/g.33527  ORF Transcript_22375/g.33527 Transcript_22375/m.33527 type:complete len:87 (+) Transcript_22375:81-341(+)
MRAETHVRGLNWGKVAANAQLVAAPNPKTCSQDAFKKSQGSSESCRCSNGVGLIVQDVDQQQMNRSMCLRMALLDPAAIRNRKLLT